MNLKEENKLIRSIENDEWKTSKNSTALKKQLTSSAHKKLLKDGRMNIRINTSDLESLKVKALEEGMPYQTLVSSILHKYVTGKLVEK